MCAWSWSHTQSAYDAVYEQLQNQDREWLNVVFAEWKAYQKGRKEDDYEERFNNSCYNRTMKWLTIGDGAKLDNDTLADSIWEWAGQLATCDNGGWNAWVCPYGCHTLPFTPPEEDEEEDDEDE